MNENSIPPREHDPQAQVAARSARPAAARHVVGGVNIGTIPVEVVSRAPESSSSVRTTPFAVRSDGSLSWNADSAASAVRSHADESRSLARRELPWEPSDASLDHADYLPAHAPPKRNELEKIHGLLRGRYPWAILLALILGGAGVYGGMQIGRKSYQSSGLITVTPVIPTAMYHLPDKEINASFEQFMDAQAARLRTQHVTDMALDDPAWQSLGRQKSEAMEVEFTKNLEVSRQGEVLVIKFVDTDREVAAVAVQTLMNAYKKLFEADEAQSDIMVQDALTVTRDNTSADLRQLRLKIAENAGMYGPEGLQSQRQFKLSELQDLQKDMDQASRAQSDSLANATGSNGGAGATSRPATGQMSPEELAGIDGPMQRLVDQRADWESQIALMESQGIGSSHQRMTHARGMLKLLARQIEERADVWQSMRDRGFTPGTGVTGLTSEQIKAKLVFLDARKKVLEAELRGLTTQVAIIDELREGERRTQQELSATEDMIHQRRVEGRLSGRVHIGNPDRPLIPYRDTRVTFAAAGGTGGVLLGFGLILLLGFMDKRVRHVGEAQQQFAGGPVLGLLPQLPNDLTDPVQAAHAAHSVHEIRTLLQIWGGGHGRQVFGITSSAAGSGKTSLTLALGVSFASARFKTLLIDCDLVGGGLTSRIDAMIRRKIGRILTRDGYITEAQLAEALRLANGADRRRLGELLIELGHLTEEDLATAIEAQADEPVGLLDALEGEDFKSCITQAGIPGLWVLPLGGATAQHASTLSPKALQRVIAAARAEFDVVLIDTGPVPGSLEASVTASQVDAVVLTVARGDQKPNVERSISHLASLGTHIAGVVFNRAKGRDVDQYDSSRRSSIASQSNGNGVQMHDAPESARLGPVARAVASFAPRKGPYRG